MLKIGNGMKFSEFYWYVKVGHNFCCKHTINLFYVDSKLYEQILLVGSEVNFLTYRYRADKSTIFSMRGLWGLTINSAGGATLKYL